MTVQSRRRIGGGGGCLHRAINNGRVSSGVVES
jgi:hypothetical protein